MADLGVSASGVFTHASTLMGEFKGREDQVLPLENKQQAQKMLETLRVYAFVNSESSHMNSKADLLKTLNED